MGRIEGLDFGLEVGLEVGLERKKISPNVAFIGFEEREGSRVPYSVGERKKEHIDNRNEEVYRTFRSRERDPAPPKGGVKIFTLSSPHPHPLDSSIVLIGYLSCIGRPEGSGTAYF